MRTGDPPHRSLPLLGLRFRARLRLASAYRRFRCAPRAETTVLGDLISRALSTPTTRVSIGAVEGALSSDATIRNIAITDRDGVWLRLDRARLIWRRAALFSRRLEVDRLEIGTLEFLRRPVPGGGGRRRLERADPAGTAA